MNEFDIDKFDDLAQKLINLLRVSGYDFDADKLDSLCYDILYKIEHNGEVYGK